MPQPTKRPRALNPKLELSKSVVLGLGLIVAGAGWSRLEAGETSWIPLVVLGGVGAATLTAGIVLYVKTSSMARQRREAAAPAEPK